LKKITARQKPLPISTFSIESAKSAIIWLVREPCVIDHSPDDYFVVKFNSGSLDWLLQEAVVGRDALGKLAFVWPQSIAISRNDGYYCATFSPTNVRDILAAHRQGRIPILDASRSNA
jgi:hypothetical protein